MTVLSLSYQLTRSPVLPHTLMVKKKVLIAIGAVGLFFGTSSAAEACQNGACAPSTAAEQSNTTSNYAAPTAVSNTTASPVGSATGVNYNSQVILPEGGRSTFEGVVNLPGGTSVKGAVSCGNNSASLAVLPQMVGDNRWIITGAFNYLRVFNPIDCRGQQEIVECGQLLALGSSGSFYDKKCGKYGLSRPTPVVADTRPIELRTSAYPVPSSTVPSSAAPSLMEPSASSTRPPVRQRF